MLDKLLSYISPHTCCSCGALGSLLCECCKDDILEEAYVQCLRCLTPTNYDNLCSNCQKHVHYSNAWVLGERQDSLKMLIDLYKFERAYEASRILAEMMARRLPRFPDSLTVSYIPDIPSHRRLRGHDHMQLIAKQLCRRRGWNLEPVLERNTSISQRGLKQQDRLKSQQSAFRAKKTVQTPILLLDDIYTTGATISAGVTALRQVTDQPVYVSVIARQPFDARARI